MAQEKQQMDIRTIRKMVTEDKIEIRTNGFVENSNPKWKEHFLERLDRRIWSIGRSIERRKNKYGAKQMSPDFSNEEYYNLSYLEDVHHVLDITLKCKDYSKLEEVDDILVLLRPTYLEFITLQDYNIKISEWAKRNKKSIWAWDGFDEDVVFSKNKFVKKS